MSKQTAPASPAKCVEEGALILKRSDVRGLLFKLARRYKDNMRAAEAEDNEDWRFQSVQKLRLINELHERIETECPTFVNKAQSDQSPKGGDAETGSMRKHASGVGKADAPKGSQLDGGNNG